MTVIIVADLEGSFRKLRFVMVYLLIGALMSSLKT